MGTLTFMARDIDWWRNWSAVRTGASAFEFDPLTPLGILQFQNYIYLLYGHADLHGSRHWLVKELRCHTLELAWTLLQQSFFLFFHRFIFPYGKFAAWCGLDPYWLVLGPRCRHLDPLIGKRNSCISELPQFQLRCLACRSTPSLTIIPTAFLAWFSIRRSSVVLNTTWLDMTLLDFAICASKTWFCCWLNYWLL